MGYDEDGDWKTEKPRIYSFEKYIIFFIIIVSFLNISLKAEDYNFKNYTLNEFIDKSNSDLEKASSIKDFQNLKKI